MYPRINYFRNSKGLVLIFFFLRAMNIKVIYSNQVDKKVLQFIRFHKEVVLDG
jgi:hypothetical protein